jgi:hypothetical protein
MIPIFFFVIFFAILMPTGKFGGNPFLSELSRGYSIEQPENFSDHHQNYAAG